ncbi:hypothetical protein BDW69DRAFT_181405 [Aspergillus filifer]
MADANMFLVYASSNQNNVTVSPRTAPGHIPPTYNPATKIAVLPGSGIDATDLTAAIECFTCLKGYGGFMDFDSPNAQWVWAFREIDGEEQENALRSDDIAAPIGFHDAFGAVIVDLSRAKTGPSSSRDLFADPDFTAARPVEGAGDDDGSSGGLNEYNAAIAHGILMSISFLVLFPLFALSVPLRYPLMKIHAPLQAITVGLILIGAVLGFNLWSSAGRFIHTHAILGLILVSAFTLVQPALGYLQHRHFVRVRGKSYFAYVHRWVGRVGILLGVLNGALGFLWVGASDRHAGGWNVAFVWYVFVAVVLGVAYVGVRARLSVGEKPANGVQPDVDDGVVGGYMDVESDEDLLPSSNGHGRVVPT